MKRDGFSILEVLVALAVFAIGAGGMLTVLGSHLRDVSYLKDQARAVRIARSKLDELRRIRAYEPLEESGTEDRFSWVCRVTDEGTDEIPGEEFFNDAVSDPDILASLQVVVSWSETEGGALSKKVRLSALHSFAEEE